MKRLIILACSSILWLASCSAPLVDPPSIQEEFSTDGIRAVNASIDQGKIWISNSLADQISTNSTTDINANQKADTLFLKAEGMAGNDRVEILLPADLDLSITTFRGDIQVQGKFSNLYLRNTAGDTVVKDFQGSATLWSGRGDTAIQEGSGAIVVFGEHGQIEMTRFSGSISASTIMGGIHFTGIEEGDQPINLESDHGSITALLPERSNYTLLVTTASGNLVCQGESLEYISRGCQGTTGTGQGTLSIRSVSGAVEVRMIP